MDDKVSVFNSIIIKMFDQTVTVRTVRANCSDKPWMTRNITALIKERQKAFTKYESLRAKVTKLISNAKATYYKSRAKGCHKSNPAKCINLSTSSQQQQKPF